MSSREEELIRIAGPVSRETMEAVFHFERIFAKWSRRINLAAPSTLDDVWRRHILDSAQLLRMAEGAVSWADFGSGGGFPGAVIAILLRDSKGARVDLIESNSKKAAFLKTVLGETSRIATVHAMRVDDAVHAIARPDIVTARAFAPLPKIMGLAEPWLTAGTRGLFHKGRDCEREIAEISDEWRFDLLNHASAVAPDSHILDFRNVRRRRA